jgi:hypothetical protein
LPVTQRHAHAHKRLVVPGKKQARIGAVPAFQGQKLLHRRHVPEFHGVRVIGAGEAHTISAGYAGDCNFSASVSNTLTQTVDAVTSGNLQQVLSPSTPVVSLNADTTTDADAVVTAVNGLEGVSPSAPVTVQLNLGSGSYTDFDASPPAGVTLVITGNGSTTTIVGQSPALTVTSGTVVVSGRCRNQSQFSRHRALLLASLVIGGLSTRIHPG